MGKRLKYDGSLPLCPTVLVFSRRAASRQRNNKAQGADSCFLSVQKKKNQSVSIVEVEKKTCSLAKLWRIDKVKFFDECGGHVSQKIF